MANLYYNAAVDATWDTLGNWWNDAAFTDPALALPADGDDVYLGAAMSSGPSVSVTLNHIYVADASTGGGSFYVNFSGAIGDATFNDNSNNYGIVSGDATFNDSSNNYGTVAGNATFNDSSINDGGFYPGTVTGDATFNDSSINNGGTVTGNATFNDGSFNEGGTVSGDATFNDGSHNDSGTVTGDATFNDSSINNGGFYPGTVTGNATFHNASRNSGTVTGNATVYYDGGDGQNPIGGTVSGTVTYIGFPLTAGCKAYWNLNDDGYGGVSLVDSTGNGNTLTNGDSALGAGIIAGGASFNGSGGLSIANAQMPDQSSAFSVSFWVKTTEETEIIGQWQVGGSWVFTSSSGNAYVSLFNNNGGPSISSGVSIIDNNWHHGVLTFSGSVATFYLDGTSKGTYSYSPYFTNRALYIGYVDNLIWNGSIDEIGVWSRELSSQEVTKLYSNGSGNTYPFPQPATQTLYYNNSQEDGDWGNVLNWWQDSAFTFPATALPTSTNPVNLYGSVTQNTQGADQCFCHDSSFWSADFGVGLTIVSTGIVNVQGSSVFDGYTEDGISMHDSTIIGPDGVIATNAVLRDGATNQGTIIGNAEVHYDGGNGVFPIGGTVGGSVTYVGWPAATPQWFNDDPSVGGGNDGDFSNLLNWWTDSNYNVRPLNSTGTQELPDVSTDVFIAPHRGFYANTGAINPTVNSINATNNGYIASISITVSNGVQFSGDDYYGCYHATIYGNVTFSGTAYNDSSMILGNADYKSAVSLVTSFYYNSLQRILSGGVYGSNTMTVSIPTGGDQMIARLLNLPWFINL